MAITAAKGILALISICLMSFSSPALATKVSGGDRGSGTGLAEAKKLNRQVIKLYLQGRYAEAIVPAKKALAIRLKALGPDHPDVARSLGNLAELYQKLGSYAQALTLFKRALAIQEKALGPNHSYVASTLNSLAELYKKMGAYARAVPLYKRALAIWEKVSPDHPFLAICLNDLAALYEQMGSYAQAWPLYKRALAITEKDLGPNHPLVAGVINNLALLVESVLVAPAVKKLACKPTKAQVAAARKIGQPVCVTNSIGMEFVLIPAGSFIMGSPSGIKGRDSDEGPQHRVLISQSFYMLATEVTQAQWRSIMGDHPSHHRGCDRCPVEQVSWQDARDFIRRLNAREKTDRYRLPTEAEWEYACRAGTTTIYYFGNDPGRLGAYAWYSVNSRDRTHPVAQKRPNPWGLYDMHGNVYEWCHDWYGRDYYKSSPGRDPKGPNPWKLRVLRGGALNDKPIDLHSAHRYKLDPHYNDYIIGFRVVRNIKPLPSRPKIDRGGHLRKKRVIVAGARPTKAQVAAAKKIGQPVFLTNSIGMKFVLIPPGSFVMGSPSDEWGRQNYEGPQHLVVISRAYYLQTTEVTQAQWRRIMGTNPSYHQACDPCPVGNVSWNDAQEFIRRLNTREKTNKYRLPTEAQWEYACRAQTTTPFYFGETISTDQANYMGNYSYGSIIGSRWSGHYRGKTSAVGAFPPNRWGLYDMHGNVAEWCRDWYGEDYYRTSPTRDPQGPSSGKDRVLRGGSWDGRPWNLRSAYRDRSGPGFRHSNFGFRVLRIY